MIKYYFGTRMIGKTAMLIEMAEKDAGAPVIQPSVHWLPDGVVKSRNGKEMPCITVSGKDKITPIMKGHDRVYVDEVVMMSNAQLEEMEKSATECICFGLYDPRVVLHAMMTIRL